MNNVICTLKGCEGCHCLFEQCPLYDETCDPKCPFAKTTSSNMKTNNKEVLTDDEGAI